MKNVKKLLLGMVLFLTLISLKWNSMSEVSAEEAADYDEPVIEEVDQNELSDNLFENEGVFEYKVSGSQSYWASFGSSYYYNQLNTNEKNLYNAWYSQCMGYLLGTSNIPVTSQNYLSTTYYMIPAVSYSNLSSTELYDTALIFVNSNPQFYFLSGSYITYSTSDQNRGSVTLNMYSDFTSGTARQTATNSIYTKVNSWLTQINQQSSTVEKERKAHDLIALNTTYQDTDDASYDQSAASVFLKGQSVCAGYSEAFEFLCNGAGIDSIIVTSSGHEWSQVKIGGTWYAVDVTWDDPDSGTTVDYDYFNVSDSTLRAGNGYHMPESRWSTYNRPSCLYDYGSEKYIYNNVDYSSVFNPTYYADKYSDLKSAFGYDSEKLLEHFVNCGMSEGRQAISTFEVHSYLLQYSDLRRAFGTNLKNYYLHYISSGKSEGRVGTGCTSMRGATTVYKGVDYSKVYDYNYYVGKYADLKSVFVYDDAAAVAHFVNSGMSEGRQAKSTFEVHSYLLQYSDLRRAFGTNLKNYYLHYISSGKSEGRAGTGCTTMTGAITTYNGVNYSSVYDYNYYVGKYSDLKSAFYYDDYAVLQHFVNSGMSEGRQAKSTFDVNSYRLQYSDLRRAFGSNLKNYYLHYVSSGRSEGRAGTGCTTMMGAITVYNGIDYSSVYDYNYYVNKYSDLKSAFYYDDAAALAHFVNYGMSEGRQASASFNVYTYKNNYADLQNAFGNDLKQYYLHYICSGKAEGRTAV